MPLPRRREHVSPQNKTKKYFAFCFICPRNKFQSFNIWVFSSSGFTTPPTHAPGREEGGYFASVTQFKTSDTLYQSAVTPHHPSPTHDITFITFVTIIAVVVDHPRMLEGSSLTCVRKSCIRSADRPDGQKTVSLPLRIEAGVGMSRRGRQRLRWAAAVVEKECAQGPGKLHSDGIIRG